MQPSKQQQFFKAQARRTRLLASINRLINEHLALRQGLFDVAGRCLYTVEIVPCKGAKPAYAEVHVLGSYTPKSQGQTVLLCNQQLYGQCRYWGEIQYLADEWQFIRTTNIKTSRSVFSGNVLFGFEVDLSALPIITRETLNEVFARYIQDAAIETQLQAERLTGRAQG